MEEGCRKGEMAGCTTYYNCGQGQGLLLYWGEIPWEFCSWFLIEKAAIKAQGGFSRKIDAIIK